MSLNSRLFSEALRDMQRAMSAFEHPALSTVGPLLGNRIGAGIRYPTADLVETPNAYELHVDLPGFDKKNIKIEMPDSQTLILSGSVHESRTENSEEPSQQTEEVTDNKEKKETSNETQVATKDNSNQVGQYQTHFWVKERVNGAFSRSFRFPTPVKTEDIKACFKDGTLNVVVPKSSENEPKKINIE